MKKTSISILVLFTFIVGFSVGMYFGIEPKITLVQDLIEKGSYDTLMLIGTIIAASGTAAATWFAIALYLTWKSQQTEIDLMAIRKDMLKTLISIEKSSSRLFMNYRTHANPSQRRVIEEDLGQLFSNFRSDLMLFYTLKGGGQKGITYQTSLEPQSDFLDSSKYLYRFCHSLYSASTLDYIESKKSQKSFFRDISLNISFDFGGVLTEYEDLKCLVNNNVPISPHLSELLSVAAADISKENAKSSI